MNKVFKKFLNTLGFIIKVTALTSTLSCVPLNTLSTLQSYSAFYEVSVRKNPSNEIKSVLKLTFDLPGDVLVSSATGFVIQCSKSECPEFDAKPGTSLILTNNHFCEIGLDIPSGRFYLETYDSDQFSNTPERHPIRLLKTDSSRDLCVLEAQMSLPSTKLSKTSGVQPGTAIRIIGAPLGTFPIITDTYVSGFIGASNLNGMISPMIDDIIMISGIIYPGHSGSPVFDKKGEVIGIIFISIRRRFNTEYGGGAIPASEIRKFLKTL